MSNYKKAIIIISTLVITGGCVGAWLYFNKDTSSQRNHSPEDAIDYGPPTSEEQQSGDNQKDQTLKNEDDRNTSASQDKQTTSVIITDAAQYDNTVEVRAFVPNHYQDGTCTITFTQGNNKVEKSTPAYRDASTTICTNPLFARSEFPTAGSWQVVVSYKADDTQGRSESKTVIIK